MTTNNQSIQQRTQKNPNNLIAVGHLLQMAINREIVDELSGGDMICYGTLVESFYHRAVSYTDDLPFIDDLITEWNSGDDWIHAENCRTIRDLRDWIITRAEKFIIAEN